jgi:hypothetical protein
MFTIIWDIAPVQFQFSFFSYFVDGWGLKGHGGEFRHKGVVAATATKTYKNNDNIGFLLNMNECELTIFINKKKVLSYQNKEWEVCSKRRILYP